MNKSIPAYLRLLSDADALAPADDDLARWNACCEAFAASSGWKLSFGSGAVKADSTAKWSAPISSGKGTALGHVRIESRDGDESAPRVSLAKSKALAQALGELWGELLATREALWRSEAELAAGVPVAKRADETTHLAERLEAALGAGAEGIRCQSAALYMLDEGTSQLKLRASWGMPRRSLLEPARALRGAAADLEALLGHAVVISDPRLFEFWKVPQACAAAACVPVSSPTNLLGTLWVFSHEQRDFTDEETNLLEIVAGRVAADLEREMLLSEVERLRARGAASAEAALPALALPDPASPAPASPALALPDSASPDSKAQAAGATKSATTRAASVFATSSHRLAPLLLDGWEAATWQAENTKADAAAWIDWFAVSSDHMAFTAGRAQGPASQVAEAALRSAARAASSCDMQPEDVMRRANAALWALDAGDARSGLAYLKLDTHHGLLRGALVGDVGLAFACPGRTPNAHAWIAEQRALASDEMTTPLEQTLRFRMNDWIAVWSGPAVRRGTDLSAIALKAMQDYQTQPMAARAEHIGRQFASRVPGAWATLVLRRR